jgi:hypothetical protein
MFIHNKETRMDWFNHHSMDFIEFELIGKLLGLAIYNDVILDLQFPHVLYKKLCGIPVTFEDLKETHPVGNLLKIGGKNVSTPHPRNFFTPRFWKTCFSFF